jgi:hypothetical protein
MAMRLLDPRFNYVPSVATDVTATWRRFGYRPLTDDERRARARKRNSAARPLAPVIRIPK